MQWAAMQFLLKATRESRGKKRLRHIIILTCRALALAALAVAIAGPLVGGFLGWSGGSTQVVVLILDRSASMETRGSDGVISRRAAALERIRDSFANLGSARLVLIDSATGDPQEVPSPDVLPDLSSTSATDTAADIPSLVTRAAEYLVESKAGKAEVWIASDLQSGDWKPEADRWAGVRATLSSVPQPPALRILALNEGSTDNQTLRLLSCRRQANELLLEIEISRTNTSATLNLPITIELNGVRTSDTITLNSQSFRFLRKLPLPSEPASGFGWIALPADANPRDNVAYFAYGPSVATKSLLVTGPGEAAEYLSLAAAPPGLESQSIEAFNPGATAIPWATASTVFWAAPLPTGSVAEQATRFLEAGGHIVFFPPAASNNAKFLGVSWKPMDVSPEGKFFVIREWNHEDGLLRDGIDGTPIPVDRMKSIRRQVPEGDLTHLAKWDDSTTFLGRQIVGSGTAWFVASLPDYSWSNLGDADVLLPLVQRAIRAGSERFDASYLAAVGSDAAKTTPGNTLTRQDHYEDESTAEPEYRAGVYRQNERLIATNRPLSEDTPDIITPQLLASILEGTDYRLLEQEASSDGAPLFQEAWRSFIIAMLLFLISEAILCLPKKSALATISASKTPSAA